MDDEVAESVEMEKHTGNGRSGDRVFSDEEIKAFYKEFRKDPGRATIKIVEKGMKKLPPPDKVIKYIREHSPEEAFNALYGNEELQRYLKIGRGIIDFLYRQGKRTGVPNPSWEQVIDTLTDKMSMLYWLKQFRPDLFFIFTSTEYNTYEDDEEEPVCIMGWFFRLCEIAQQKLKEVEGIKVKPKKSD